MDIDFDTAAAQVESLSASHTGSLFIKRLGGKL